MNVIWVSEWPVNEVEEFDGYCAYLENVKGWEKGANTVFIFDEAEQTYWDQQLWRDFFRMLRDYDNLRAIAFASYGDPSSRIIVGQTPIYLTGRQRVTLTAIPQSDGLPPVGLLLSEEEMAEFRSVLYPQPNNYFDLSFFDALFALTEGHVGAACGFAQTIATHGVGRILGTLEDVNFTFSVVSRTPKLPWPTLHLGQIYELGWSTRFVGSP